METSWPTPPAIPDAPSLPPHPGDPPPLPRDVPRTLEVLEWCAKNAPQDLEHALVGSLKLHGLEFAEALRIQSWQEILQWGRPLGRGLPRATAKSADHPADYR